MLKNGAKLRPDCVSVGDIGYIRVFRFIKPSRFGKPIMDLDLPNSMQGIVKIWQIG